jgi:hypothetical protein
MAKKRTRRVTERAPERTERPVLSDTPDKPDKSAPAEKIDKVYWLDHKRNVDKVFYGLVLICAVLFSADLVYHKHITFPFEGWLGFYAWYGFVCCVSLVLLAKQMRRIVKRREDYYD